VSADGGTVRTILTRDSAGHEPRWPNLLPDGRHFIFFRSSSGPEERGVYLGSVDSSEVRQLVPSEFKGAYASGHLLYVRDDNTLMAQPFDVTRLALTGKPTRVADGIWTARGAGQASFSVSRDGVLAYVNARVAYQQVASYDRSGRLRGVAATSPIGVRRSSSERAPSDRLHPPTTLHRRFPTIPGLAHYLVRSTIPITSIVEPWRSPRLA